MNKKFLINFILSSSEFLSDLSRDNKKFKSLKKVYESQFTNIIYESFIFEHLSKVSLWHLWMKMFYESNFINKNDLWITYYLWACPQKWVFAMFSKLTLKSKNIFIFRNDLWIQMYL